MTSEEYSAVNTLLAYLRSSNVVDLVRDWYMRYQNSAPHTLLKEQMDKVQNILDKKRD